MQRDMPKHTAKDNTAMHHLGLFLRGTNRQRTAVKGPSAPEQESIDSLLKIRKPSATFLAGLR